MTYPSVFPVPYSAMTPLNVTFHLTGHQAWLSTPRSTWAIADRPPAWTIYVVESRLDLQTGLHLRTARRAPREPPRQSGGADAGTAVPLGMDRPLPCRAARQVCGRAARRVSCRL